MSNGKKSRTSLYVAIVIAIVVIVVAGVVIALMMNKSGGGTKPSTQVTLYAGESGSTYGFGSSSSSISSPGPTLTFTAGETITVTLNDVGKMPHNWAIVDAESSTANVLWNAKIASAGNPVSPGGSASVTFTVGSAGSYYYICQVPGHVSLGMWGIVTVNP